MYYPQKSPGLLQLSRQDPEKDKELDGALILPVDTKHSLFPGLRPVLMVTHAGGTAERPVTNLLDYQQVSMAERDVLKRNQAVQALQEQVQEPTQVSCSESRLRRVMTNHCASTEELRQTIGSVEALLAEAKRELAARELRERRAAYERLHAAVGSSNASELEEAIVVATGLDIDGTDIDLAKSKLEHLRSLSLAEVAAQEERKQLMETKLRAYQLVKQGKAAALKEHLQPYAGAWSHWRDHSGRSLLVYARQVRAKNVQDCLEQLLLVEVCFAKLMSPASSSPRSGTHSPRCSPRPSPCRLHDDAGPREGTYASLHPCLAHHVQREAATPPEKPATNEAKLPSRVTAPETSSGHKKLTRVTTPEVAPWRPDETRSSDVSRCASAGTAKNAPLASPGEAEGKAALRLQAFRAVVKDDTRELNNILNKLPQDVWSSWQNKAGKDLLTLAQERRSTGSYALIGRALGLLQERKREAFEERETVWVLVPGEVQARHGTVVEDAPADGDDELLIEFWDRLGPPQRVDRAHVLKAM